MIRYVRLLYTGCITFNGDVTRRCIRYIRSFFYLFRVLLVRPRVGDTYMKNLGLSWYRSQNDGISEARGSFLDSSWKDQENPDEMDP